ncbi:MAG: ATP-binding protein [Fulvivirga sp.]|uniref:hybrid sensor histidine kinase/response regulator n=3 Tax=Fulvivirga sp. TaxID=1931237 RepID=UPI0032EA9014
MHEPLKILFIEDAVDDFDLVLLELKRASLNVVPTRVETEDKIKSELSASNYNLVISDNQLPTLNAKKSLEIVRNMNSDIPFVLVSGSIGEEYAVELMKLGVSDYILKSNLSRLAPVVLRECQEYSARIREKNNSRKLILSELRFQNLTESIADVFFALDAHLNVIFWNSVAEKEFDKKVLPGSKLFALFPKWTNDQIGHAISSTMENFEPSTFKLQHKNGETAQYFEGTVSKSGQGVSVLLRKVTETYLNRQRLELLNTELETLLYRIGHDLKGPISSVLGLLNIMKISEKIEKTEFIEMMETRMNNLESILKVLKDVAQIKYSSPNAQLLNLKDCLSAICDAIVSEEMYDNVNIKLNEGEEINCWGELALFKSIIQNLIENGIKYGENKHGKVEIDIDYKKVDDKVVISISDYGRGIPEDMHSKIFEMFYRGNEKSQGSGMGLYIVRHALGRMGGTILIDKEYKQGACFKIIMPILKKKEGNGQ